MAEENQVRKEPQQVKQEERSKEERRTSVIGEDRSKPILWNWGCYSSESDRWPWLLHLSNQKGEQPSNPQQNNPKPHPQAQAQTNKSEMD